MTKLRHCQLCISFTEIQFDKYRQNSLELCCMQTRRIWWQFWLQLYAFLHNIYTTGRKPLMSFQVTTGHIIYIQLS